MKSLKKSKNPNNKNRLNGSILDSTNSEIKMEDHLNKGLFIHFPFNKNQKQYFESISDNIIILEKENEKIIYFPKNKKGINDKRFEQTFYKNQSNVNYLNTDNDPNIGNIKGIENIEHHFKSVFSKRNENITDSRISQDAVYNNSNSYFSSINNNYVSDSKSPFLNINIPVVGLEIFNRFDVHKNISNENSNNYNSTNDLINLNFLNFQNPIQSNYINFLNTLNTSKVAQYPNFNNNFNSNHYINFDNIPNQTNIDNERNYYQEY